MRTITTYLLLIFFWILSLSLNAQSNRWVKEFDLGGTEFVEEILAVDDGYINIGKFIHEADKGMFIYKIDTSGILEWINYYSLDDIPSDNVKALKKVDNGFIVLAEDILYGNNIVGKSHVYHLNETGDIIWIRSHILEEEENKSVEVNNILVYPDGSYTYSGFIDVSTPHTVYNEDHSGNVFHELFIQKIDHNGNELWTWQLDTVFHANHEARHKNILATPDGGCLLIRHIGHYTGLPDSSTLVLYKLDSNGETEWTKHNHLPNHFIREPLGFVQTSDGSYFIKTYDLDPNGLQFSLHKINQQGDLLWSQSLFFVEGPTYYTVNVENESLEATHDGGIITTIRTDNHEIYKVFKISSEGQITWEKSIHHAYNNNRIISTPDNGFLAVGSTTPFYGVTLNVDLQTNIRMYKMDRNGNYYPKTIEGNAFLDYNDNCNLDALETPKKGIILEINNDSSSFFIATDSLGYYALPVDTGHYEVIIHPWSPYVDVCQASHNIVFENPFLLDSAKADFPLEILAECPYMEVDISTSSLRDCFTNTYFVKYKNSGTSTAEDAYIELTIPESLNIESATIPFSGPTENDIYTFQLGNVNPEDIGLFSLDILLPCDTLGFNGGLVTGNTYCVEAHIYPDSICQPISPLWDGSSIQLTGECLGDSIYFKIKNIGNGDMIIPRNYHVIEDEIMVTPGTFQLNAGQEEFISIYANGATYRLEAEQDPEHPSNSSPSIALEACGEGTQFSQGFINNFAQNDVDPFISIECREVTGSYDPNDKQGFPLGNTEDHNILNNSEIEYLVRFQNTGNDTAFTVVVKDVISEHLDITSINPGASSHPYVFSIKNGRTAVFTFNHILLVDSLTNEAGSQGFIKFRIAQMPDLAIGTRIENEAKIYFDFNPHILTNTAFHTISENTFSIEMTENPTIEDLVVKAYPNPFIDHITFELKSETFIDEIDFSVYDITGRQVQQETFFNNVFQFHKGNLPFGIYFYKIEQNGKQLASGKIILQ